MDIDENNLFRNKQEQQLVLDDETNSSEINNKNKGLANNEYQTVHDPNSEILLNEKDANPEQIDGQKKFTADGPPQTGKIIEKKVRFVEKPEVFLVESYKKYNQINYKESCCDCTVF